ncbi:MAG: BrnA antitoxin family protein [Methylococcales bacterium]
MPALKPGTVIPTDEEDAMITAGALSNPDALPLTDAEWESVKPILRVGGRPKAEVTKERITIRLSPNVLAAFKATGKGWQSRIDAVLKE